MHIIYINIMSSQTLSYLYKRVTSVLNSQVVVFRGCLAYTGSTVIMHVSIK